MSVKEVRHRQAKFDCILFVTDEEDGLLLELEYCDLFDHSTMQRLAGHFQTLLANLTANPDQSIARVKMLTEAEHEALRSQGRHGLVQSDIHSCIHTLFEAYLTGCVAVDCPRLLIDEEWEQIAQESTFPPDANSAPEHAAERPNAC
jgi:non-ribosomal peptide synthetase component F